VDLDSPLIHIRVPVPASQVAISVNKFHAQMGILESCNFLNGYGFGCHMREGLSRISTQQFRWWAYNEQNDALTSPRKS
jgi:hypothetical protein